MDDPPRTALAHTGPAGVVGIWSIEHGEPVSQYLPWLTGPAEARGTQTVNAKGTAVPWTVWFRRLADRTPHADDYTIVQLQPDETLLQALLRLHHGG